MDNEKKKKEMMKEAVAANQLFFAVSCTMNYQPCIAAMKWFRQSVVFSRNYTDISRYLSEYSEDPDMLHSIVQTANENIIEKTLDLSGVKNAERLSANRSITMKRVTAALLIKDGLCLIAKRRSGDSLANLWEFPGGKIEVGETPEECLRREMYEELQIDVEVGQFFCESIYEYEFGVNQLLVYWAKWKGNSLYLAVHDEIAWVDKQTILNYEFLPADIPVVEKLRNCNDEF